MNAQVQVPSKSLTQLYYKIVTDCLDSLAIRLQSKDLKYPFPNTGINRTTRLSHMNNDIGILGTSEQQTFKSQFFRYLVPISYRVCE